MAKILHITPTQLKNRMEQHANKHGSERSLEVAECVFVRLQPYGQHVVGPEAIKNQLPSFMGPI